MNIVTSVMKISSTFKNLIKNSDKLTNEKVVLSNNDIVILEKMAIEQNVSVDIFISYILHKFIKNELIDKETKIIY